MRLEWCRAHGLNNDVGELLQGAREDALGRLHPEDTTQDPSMHAGKDNEGQDGEDEIDAITGMRSREARRERERCFMGKREKHI